MKLTIQSVSDAIVACKKVQDMFGNQFSPSPEEVVGVMAQNPNANGAVIADALAAFNVLVFIMKDQDC